MKKKLNLRCDSLPSNCLQVKIEKAEFNLTIIDFFVHLRAAEKSRFCVFEYVDFIRHSAVNLTPFQ